ncbi:autotransporter outer membrane beta-barrel domain-containing protein [Bartonella gliris]|uniref:autotransporter outer membrane beta-barrel domain-containing protein n=1 Tax=Bartonella gliris TaxID=3004109 RepID=UPI00387311DA
MYKKSLLSYATTAAIILFNIHLNAHAETLEGPDEKKAETLEVSEGTVSVSDKTYETLHAKTGGKITGKDLKDLTIIGNKNINSSENKTVYAVTAEGADSAITLQGNTTIKGTDSVISLGVEAKNGAMLQMTGGTITVSDIGATFFNSTSTENKLEGVTISGGKGDALLNFGIKANKSTVTLKDVKVSQAHNAVFADNSSTITVSGGSFDAKEATVSAANGSTITLKDDAKITSSENAGLYAHDNGTIKMTGGTVTGKTAALAVEKGGHITSKDVVLKTTDGDGIGASADGSNSVIELLGNTTISDTKIGLAAQNSGAISMTGGTITASVAGATFSNSKSAENKLEGVTISSSKGDALLTFGIKADKSTVTLKDVKVSQAHNAVFANDDSTITVSGGSFDAKEATVSAANGSTITLKDDAKITSSENAGLYAHDNGTIKMTGGTVTGKTAALAVEKGGHITSKDVVLKTTDGDGIGADAVGSNSVIELLGNTTISDTKIGLFAQDSGAISMTGGTITASVAGGTFSNSKSAENKLEDVTISSSKEGALLNFGIKADKSTVTLKDVKVSQAHNAVFANDHSTITISGGSFDAKDATIYAADGSTITLKDDAKITSSESFGLYAQDSGAISMTGGSITASVIGATFSNSKSAENKLEDVTISSSKEGALLNFGIKADKSTVTLKDVKVSQAINSVFADNSSTITVSGGSFDAKNATVSAANGGTVILTGVTHITSSENSGLYAHDNGVIKMTGGTITNSKAGATFSNSTSTENKLEGVTISGGKGDALLNFGIKADKSTVTLKDVKVSQAHNAVFANDHSTITISGGSFDAKEATVSAANGSTVTLTDNAEITSSESFGLYAQDSGTTITMAKGNVTGKNITLAAENSGYITATDVVLKTTDGDGIGAGADGFKSVIELLGNTMINNAAIGLGAQNNGAISMTGGTITASVAGATFSNSTSTKNKLENVTISSGKDDAPLLTGIVAEKGSTVALKDVKVSQAKNAIAAYDDSTITVSGGSFDAKDETIYATDGGTVILTDNAQITSSDGYGLYANGLKSTITMTKGSVKGKRTALAAEDGGHITITDVTLTTEKGNSGLGANAINSDSVIELSGTTINNAAIGLYAQNNGVIKMTGGTITTSSAGATFYNSESNENKLEDVTISSSKKGEALMFTGLNSQASNVTLKNVHITNASFGAYAMDHSKITILGGSFDGNKTAVHAADGSTITLTDNAQITSSGGYGLHADGLDSTITMTTGSITGKEAALAVENGGHIDATNISATAENNGIKFENPVENTTSEINLTNAKLHVENGIGINVDESTGTVNLGKKSEIRADVLLVLKDSTKENNFTFTLNADDSVLEGGARIVNSPKTIFDLQNNAQWIVKTSTKEKGDDGNLLDIAQRSRSDISVLNLNNSSIIFNGPTEEHYHTLHIGSGKPGTSEVYNASGDAKVYFNVAWSDGLASADQKTDRLLIHGDVSGSTTVYIKSDLGDNESVINASDPSNIGGLSLIQVSGKAKEDSFKLANGYTTRGGEPYKYTLTAYGPETSHGKADIAQNLFDEKNENFWDFRLHKEILETSSGSNPDPETNVHALVPQTASYLVMPNALFYTGLTDMAKQNALLANMRTSVLGREEEKQTGFFLYTYGSTGTLSSERGPLKYGYGADIRYAALQGGITLAAIEGQSVTTHLGLLGTYGKLSFTPKDMADASKSTLDKWSLTAYGTLQHNNGLYLDTLLSYGVLKGNITNALIGKTAKLNDAKMLSISTTVGKEFATGVEGLTFEPQAQVAYQHLMFNTITDADNFTIDMNNPSQWLIRVGGRLTKTVSTENNGPMSFYGKVNLIKTFGDDGAIHIGRDFDLDPMGPAIEGGVGINAQLSHNFSLHGDVSYQQKLQKTGISGASFSGGIRYQF